MTMATLHDIGVATQIGTYSDGVEVPQGRDQSAGMSSVLAPPHVAVQVGEFRQGWPVILACFCTATFAWGFGFYGQSVYLAEFQHARGWPASLIASGTTVYYLAGAFMLTFVHRALAWAGPRMLLAGGAVILGAGAIGLSQAEVPWQLFVCSLVMAVGWACTTTTAIATTLAHWFDRRRGLAISLALNGASAGGFTIAPLLVRFGHAMGLAQAVPSLVLAALAVLLPIILVSVGRPPPEPSLTASLDRTGRVHAEGDKLPLLTSQSQVLRSPHFWAVSLPFALALAAQVGFIVHQVAFLLPRLGNHGAGIAIAGTAMAAMTGRLALGAVIDRLDQRLVSAASFTSQAAGLALMLALPETPAALYVGSMVVGLSVGNVITLPTLIIQREFAAPSFGLVIGLSSMVGQATLAFGPTLLGLARDLTGGYDAALILCIALQLTGAVILLATSGGANRA
jgi:MFS family permease